MPRAKVKTVAYREPSYSNHGTQLTEKAGEVIAQVFHKDGRDELLSESFGITFKEDVTTTNASGAYTTLLSSTLYSAALDRMQEILDLVELNEDLKNGNGFGAYQIPRLQPTIAYEVAEGAVVNYFDEGVDSITVTSRKVVAGTAITWEIMKRGMNDFAKYVLKNAADAITRKLASDIVNGLAAGAGSTTTGGITFANLVNTERDVNNAEYSNGVKYGFMADTLVLSATAFATFRLDTDVKNSMYYASAIPGQPIDAARNPLMFGNLRVVVTPFLTDALALVLEAKRNLLIKESDLETFEGAIPGRLYDREIIGLMSYVLAVLYPKSVAKVTA
jgi:hypothetical protein